MPNRAAEFRCPSAADPLPIRCRSAADTPKAHPISAVARIGRITFKELI